MLYLPYEGTGLKDKIYIPDGQNLIKNDQPQSKERGFYRINA